MTAHIFDMDGTLLRGTTASALVADVYGRHDELRALETRFASGEQTNADFARILHASWGVVSVAAAAQAFAAAPLVRHIDAVIDDIHSRGERACLITMSPDYFADLLLPFGFDAVFSSRFPREAATPLDPAGILTFEDKPRLAREFCEVHGLRIEQAVAYGDSMSDVPLFNAVGYRISINGDHHIREICDVAIRGDDLRAAYAHARRYIDQSAA